MFPEGHSGSRETGLGRGQAGVEADGPVRRRAVEKGAGPLGGEDSRNS